MAKINKKDFDRNIDDQIRGYNTLVELQKKELEGLSQVFSLESQRTKALLEVQKAENERNVRYQEYINLQQQASQGQVSVSKVTLTTIEKHLKKEQEHINKLKTKEKILRSISTIKFPDFSALAEMKMFNDKPIRVAIIELGIGAEKGQQIRDAFYEAAPKAAQLGASMKDLYQIQTQYTAESGRALALTGKQLQDITEIGKGTAIGVQNAGRLAAQFELIGINTERTKEIVQGIVDSSERMGVNVNKVLKIMSGNFKQLNTYAFKDGVKGMAKMAQYAEKFKVDINASINSAEQARTLEGAIEMASQLQILGGEFTKADPFEMFHLSRNDPGKFTQKLNEMTKGMASLVKTSEGFELKISPLDLDRLKFAAQATGQDFSNLVEQAQRMGDIQAMNRQMLGTAFSKQDRELIQSMAKLDSKAGIYKILGKDISKLSQQEIESLKIQQTTLRQRAEAAQTFDEKFANTIQSMKLTLLPILDGVNAVFDTIHPYLKGISDWMGSMPKWTKTGLAFAGGLLGAGILLGKVANVFKSIPFLGKLMSSGGATKAATSATATGAGAMGGKGAFGAGAGAGAKMLGGGAGIGLASAGIGAGINLAANGISKLADSMSKLNKEQVEALETIAVTLAVSFPLAAIGIGILAAVAAPAAIPLLALGGAILAIGAGVGIAAAGIGYMAEGFSTLLTAANPQKVFALAAGVGALGASMTALAGGSVLAMFTGAGPFAMLGLLSTRADAFERIGNSMKNIAVVLNSDGEGLARLKETLDSIQNVNSSGGLLGELKSMFKDGLKVKFDEKNVAMNVNISLEVDSDVLARKTAKKIVVLHKDYQDGKAG
jgi:hypothetical protein